MTTPTTTDQIAFRYHATDSATGLATRLLPQYDADDGPLTDEQMRDIDNAVPQGVKRSVRSSLFDIETP
ncbi:hypothetical protein F0185_07565 [Massilia sp. CCM 8692]|uniref:Uncharacterized protein n=1 Tax=Massilia rubra TaxID=2607910 RepID=A0ABX0LF43_9BURK|nr:hypothetical protein [Massilia rubra]